MQLKIDLDDLVLALSSGDELHDATHYVDVETGGIVYAGEGVEGLPGDLASRPRYRRIDPWSGAQLQQVMQSFVDQLPDRAVAAWLDQALHGDQPRRAFVEALLPFDETRLAWFRYRDAAYAELARQWGARQGWRVEWA